MADQNDSILWSLSSSILAMPFKRGAVPPYFVSVPPLSKITPIVPPFQVDFHRL